MRTRCLAVVLFATLIGGLSPARAQTPLGSEFTYQGKLNLAGTPLNASADFEFTLWDADTDGNPIGAPATLTNIDVIDGLFTVDLDFGAAAFNGDARWLQIAVASPSGADLTTLSPRQPLSAAPYALQTRGIHVDSTGRVGIGNTAPGTPLEVTGTVRAEAFIGDGSGLTNLPPVDTLWTDTGTDIYFNDGRVGIGTDAPAAALHVTAPAASAHIRLSKDNNTYENNLAFIGSGTQYNFGTPNADRLRIWASNGGEILTLLPGGNLGLRTSTPTEALHVRGGNVLADRGNATSTLTRSLTLGGARTSDFPYAQLAFQNFDDDSAAANYLGASIESANAGSSDDGDLRFSTAADAVLTEHMRITHLGDVGIGTTTPVSELDVVGTVTADAFVGNGAGLTSLPSPNSSAGRIRFANGFEFERRPVLLDQEYNLGNAFPGTLTTWQSFTAGVTGNLTAVEAYRASNAAAATVTLYAGQGSGGSLLATAAIPASPSVGWQTAEFTQAIPVVAGNQYTIQITGIAPVKWVLDGAGTYPGGRSSHHAAWDQRFRTHVLDPAGDYSPFLSVNAAGNLRFGPNAAYHAVADVAATSLVRGWIEPDGTAGPNRSSAGVTAQRLAIGRYEVTFPSGAFTQIPVVTITTFNDTGDNRYAVIDDDISTAGFRVSIRDESGILQDGAFNFIALGER